MAPALIGRPLLAVRHIPQPGLPRYSHLIYPPTGWSGSKTAKYVRVGYSTVMKMD